MDASTEALAAHIREHWYYEGCDVTCMAPKVVEVTHQDGFPVSAFCADLSQPPHNALVEITSSGMTCRIVDADTDASERRTWRWPSMVAAGVVALVALVGSSKLAAVQDANCTTLDECWDRLGIGP